MKIPSTLRWKPTGRTLGQGGQAAVIEVTDSENEFKGNFAFKGLAKGKPRTAYERFAREVDAIQQLIHPSIVSIVDRSAIDADFHFYVMHSPDGARSLRKVMASEDNPFLANPLSSLTLFTQLLDTILAYSEAGIVHRDLSPANVMLLPDGSIKVIDFGLCQIADSDTITLSDEAVGTPNYLAPECESGNEENISILADLYSAGKILWSVMTGKNAFSRESPVFNAKSMHTMFPNEPASWHLHHVFEQTIRRLPSDRSQSIDDALAFARTVRFLISSGYPPLELVGDRCPLCGYGTLGKYQGSHMVDGNPNPQGISSVQCKFCGFCFARNWEVVRDQLQDRNRLS